MTTKVPITSRVSRMLPKVILDFAWGSFDIARYPFQAALKGSLRRRVYWALPVAALVVVSGW